MRKILPGAVAAACIGFVAPATAADLPRRGDANAPAYNWTGFYVGGQVGGAFADDNSLIGRSGGRLLGGVQAGFNRQFAPGWVAGSEFEYARLVGHDHGARFPGNIEVTGNTNNLFAFTGRVGHTWGPALLYA